RVHLAAGELPDEPRFDGAEAQLTALGPRPGAGYAVQKPGDLGAREVSVDDQPCLRPDSLRHAAAVARPQLVARRGRSPALPDDGRRDRLAGERVPDDGRLALVGDADSGDLPIADPGGLFRLADRGQAALPDLLGVVADPAWPRVVLGDLAVSAPEHPRGAVEEHGGRAGRALVDRQDEAVAVGADQRRSLVSSKVIGEGALRPRGAGLRGAGPSPRSGQRQLAMDPFEDARHAPAQAGAAAFPVAPLLRLARGLGRDVPGERHLP